MAMSNSLRDAILRVAIEDLGIMDLKAVILRSTAKPGYDQVSGSLLAETTNFRGTSLTIGRFDIKDCYLVIKSSDRFLVATKHTFWYNN